MNTDSLGTRFNEAQSRLVIQTADLPLGTLANMVESGAIDLQPGFQRRERWDADKQSALIELFLLNVPVPPIYLAEEQDGTYTAIDGKQRLRTISDFFYGRFALRNLDQLLTAEGLRFSQLPREISNALMLRPFLRVVTLLKQTDEALKYEVFLRLNRGGEALNAQEIRNVAFRGPLNDAIYEMSENPFLRNCLKIDNEKSSAYRTMLDAEYVLRFLTLNATYDDFGGSLVRAMDGYMLDRQELSLSAISSLKSKFNQAISNCEAIWGNHAFRRPEGNVWRDQTLAGMYDAQMIAVTKVSEEAIGRATAHSATVLGRTKALFQENYQFDQAVRTGTNTPARIRYRVSMMIDLLETI